MTDASNITSTSWMSRRAFSAAAAGTAMAGALALAGCGTTCNTAAKEADGGNDSSASETAPTPEDAEQYGFLVVAGRCRACGACVDACRTFNDLLPDTADRRTITTVQRGSAGVLNASTACMHCESPSCVQACPAGAITKGEGGVVTVDRDLCIGCRYCHQACPYAVPTYTPRGMDKCDCCLGAGLPLGDQVACAAACPFQALYYGSLDELHDIASRIKLQAAPIADEDGPSCLIA